MTSREDSTFVPLIQCSSSVTSNSGTDCSKCFPSTSSATWTSGGSVSRSSRCDAISEPGTSEFDSKQKFEKKAMQVWRFENLRIASNRYELLAVSPLKSLEINGITWSKQVFTSEFVDEPNSGLMQNRTRMDRMKHLQETGKRYS